MLRFSRPADMLSKSFPSFYFSRKADASQKKVEIICFKQQIKNFKIVQSCDLPLDVNESDYILLFPFLAIVFLLEKFAFETVSS